MTKRNAPAVIVEDLPFEAPAGHLKYLRDGVGEITGVQFGCPCGCGWQHGATFKPPGGWTWDGNERQPTVNPSLGCGATSGEGHGVGPDGVYHWHGFLRAGVFEEC